MGAGDAGTQGGRFQATPPARLASRLHPDPCDLRHSPSVRTGGGCRPSKSSEAQSAGKLPGAGQRGPALMVVASAGCARPESLGFPGMLEPLPWMLREPQPERRDLRTPGGLGGATQAAAVRLRLCAGHLGAAVPKGAAPRARPGRRARARRAGSGYPRGEDGRHAGPEVLTGRGLTDRTFVKRNLFLNEEGKLLIC